MLKKSKPHLIFIIIIFLLSIVFLHNIISTTKIMDNIHHINDVSFISQNLKESLFEYGQLHLWTPYYYSGQPLYAQPEYYFLDFNFLYLLLFRNIFIAMNLATLSYFFLSGLGMYFLFLTFKDNKKGAFIASLIYMFNGYIHSFVIIGNLNVLASYSLIPFTFMFFVKALKSKDPIKNSIYTGIFIALQIFAGGALFLSYEIVLLGLYALFFIIGKNFQNKIIKLVIVGLLVILVTAGFSAIKLLPGAEFLELSNRGSGISYDQYLGEPIKLSNFIYLFITNLFQKSGITAYIGIVGSLLLIFSLYNYKKKYVLFSFVLIIVSVLMAVEGPIASFFFKIPVFNQLRHIERAILLGAFASSILAGSGYIIFAEKLKKLLKFNKEAIVFSIIALLILFELLFVQAFPQSFDIKDPADIPVNEFISQDKGTFRTINMGLSTLVGASGYNYLSQLGIGVIKGGSGIWFNDYLTYLSIAEQTTQARLWGLLNNKYVISKERLNIPGLKFIDEFETDEKCIVCEAYGPYLYENLEFIPRAFFVDNAILVIGGRTEQIIYSVIIDNFDPKKAVIIEGRESASQYSLEELGKYNVIMLSENIGGEDVNILRSYVNGGGILMPDVLNGETSITPDNIESLFNNFDTTFEEVEILEYENNKAVYDVKGKKGFLVLSERFSNFPGWQADGKEILKANAITTSVFVDNDEKITFKYKPRSFRNGLIISSLTLILIVIYFVYARFKGDKNKI